MQNTESFFNQSFFPMDKLPLLLPALFDSRAEQKVLRRDCDILIFSCEADTRHLLDTLFKLWKYRVEESGSTKDFWATLETHQPKMILVDDFLPFAASLEFLAEIRRHEFCKNTPVVLISGFSEAKYRKQSLAAGANDFFEKPLDFNSLENYLEEKIFNLSVNL